MTNEKMNAESQIDKNLVSYFLYPLDQKDSCGTLITWTIPLCLT